MPADREIELKFLVPRHAREALAAEMARASATLERRSLAAIYLDTPDRRLAREGIAWRLRREGRRWVQTLKAAGPNALERFEHEVLRPGAIPDASLHAGTGVGDRLMSLLRKAESAGKVAGVRYRTEVRRTLRRVRTRGAVVEVAFDEGRILAGGGPASASGAQAPPRPLRICEIEFELVSGSPRAMLALAERWRKRFGLILDPRSKAERGDRLAEGSPFPSLRKGLAPDYPRDETAIEAFGSVLDECLAQVLRNAIGLIDGDPAMRVDHVHQLRVGIRRLRSGLRSFRGWVPAPPQPLVDGLRELFATLGMSRDADVLDSGVARSLSEAGAPPLVARPAGAGPDPREALRSATVQQLLLAWLDWRVGLVDDALAQARQAAPAQVVDSGLEAGVGADAGVGVGVGVGATLADVGAAPIDAGAGMARGAGQVLACGSDPADFHRLAERRLRRWHRRLAADAKAFDTLDDTALHSLRKRIKRQRYAVEFFAPVLRHAMLARYLKRLTAVQDRMGELNDLFVARARYQALVAQDPAAWFALGWLAARIAEVKALAEPTLRRLARTDPPAR
jgi:inorganic triphosphatase YgiF